MESYEVDLTAGKKIAYFSIGLYYNISYMPLALAAVMRSSIVVAQVQIHVVVLSGIREVTKGDPLELDSENANLVSCSATTSSERRSEQSLGRAPGPAAPAPKEHT
jgi:hypothetical protein